MKIKQIYMIIFCLFWLIKLEGQQVNPFEIRDRLNNDSIRTEQAADLEKTVELAVSKDKQPKIKAAAKTSPVEPDLSINPFEILPRKDGGSFSKTKKTIEFDNQKEVKTIENTETDPAKETSTNFLFWLQLFAFLILAVSLSLDRWYITKLFKSVFNYNLSNLLLRENSGLNLILLILLFLLFVLSASIFIYLLLNYFTGYSGLKYFWYVLSAVSITYLIRHSAIRLFLLIFPKIPELTQFSFTIISFNIVLGIILLIPNLLIAFSPDIVVTIALYTGILAVLTIYLLRSFRGLLISFNYLVSTPFHFFLYICAFEIIPILVMYKLIADFV